MQGWVHSYRRLLRSPLTLAAALLAFALGIGLNASVYSLGKTLLEKPLELDALERLVVFVATSRGEDLGVSGIAPAQALAYREFGGGPFAELSYGEHWSGTLTRDGEPEITDGVRVSANWFRAVGSPFVLGRGFTDEEEQPGRHRVVVLGEGLWQRRFGGDQRVVGSTVRLNGEDYRIVGVAAQTGRYPAFANLFVPLPAEAGLAQKYDDFSYLMVGRLREGTTLAAAQAVIRQLDERWQREHPSTHEDRASLLKSLRERVAGGDDMLGQYLLMLRLAALFALLIACANVSNLQLARVTARRQEFAVLSALGAGKWQVTRLVLQEGILLALCGAGLGLIAAIWSLDGIKKLIPVELWRFVPMWPRMALDWSAAGWSTLLAVAAALVASIGPALHAARAQAAECLRENARGNTHGVGRQWFRTLLVTAQISLALALLVGAGLMIRSTQASLARFDGKRPAEIATVTVQLPQRGYERPVDRLDWLRRLEQSLGERREFGQFAVTNAMPLNDYTPTMGFEVEGRAQRSVAQRPWAVDLAVTPGYRTLMRLPLLAGRWLEAGDVEGRRPVCVIDESLAQAEFAGESPLERKLVQMAKNGAKVCTIVGVVGAEYFGAWEKTKPNTIYRPLAQALPMSVAVMARGPRAELTALRSAVRAADEEAPLAMLRSYRDVIDTTLAGMRLVAVLMTAIGLAALLLASLGIYGVMGYLVAERTGEIGMRMAIGAAPADIARLLARDGMKLCAAGFGIGLVLGAGLAKLAAGLIFGVEPGDWVTMGGVTGLLFFVAALAIYLPARRAILMDPVEALRHV
jgi:putative ABC transport system permease protein